MIEVTGNLWEYKSWKFRDEEYERVAKVITTNGAVKKNGEAVMGRGCAREAAERWEELPADLGHLLSKHGNHVFYFVKGNVDLLTFPVKHNWNEMADLYLIERSASELVHVVTALDLDVVVMPRPGCGNGGLNWTEHPLAKGVNYPVKAIIERFLDDRFHVITFPEKQA